ncbi:hypothetical protein DFJ67_7002 [Asanoa ferruginea]|uniref:DUF732 domain-containing protein n=1 Tax=Asanoa ferruginea TaxID=53367 RepID=A0A3D9ZUQ8_9ACTN|nr:hypothetical protein DFJ67_7002 [Asanoa ferruginea]GIF47527.1 hypothetical protein Afe04nite_20660 [Asanoa ferruginea]
MPIATPTRLLVAAIAAATLATHLGTRPASANPAPEPADQSAPIQTCPRIDNLAQALRAAGFTAQGAKNAALLTQRDCLEDNPTATPALAAYGQSAMSTS